MNTYKAITIFAHNLIKTH